jgi:dTDP-4-dehydrorhamnose 3,5-epimerase
VNFVPTEIPEVIRVEPEVFEDHRGYLFEAWNAREFARAGIEAEFVQDNVSSSSRGTLRGLHYQLPRPQGKLVRVVRGKVFDVVVDLRRSSATFGKWVGDWLSAEEKSCLWIPIGFAHGFYVTSEVAEFVYKCTDFYSPNDQHTLRWDDPDLAIAWPIADGSSPRLSAKDAAGLDFRSIEHFP